MTLMDDAERERLHRFAAEAHSVLYRNAAKGLQQYREVFCPEDPAVETDDLREVAAAITRALRLLEYAMADTEPVPLMRRKDDRLT